ncbi:hypothetical protein MtrunA17_Chr5g0404921 [Medicago truncatula]|uniref:Uncharacterized protein n=1 Tax=Medicago truncatula TaxID=3880 RepID=G7KGB5_MEDTR|nr:hypothetical protein MTR_5g021250 [Medicago truncatula]RHN54276.1 hypothetical protein MtrunA17_Chr5g0404921 [Medicago truncatula]
MAIVMADCSLRFFKSTPDNFIPLSDNFLMHQNTNTIDSISNPHSFFHNNNNYFFNNNKSNNPFEMEFENEFFMGNKNTTASPVFTIPFKRDCCYRWRSEGEEEERASC